MEANLWKKRHDFWIDDKDKTLPTLHNLVQIIVVKYKLAIFVTVDFILMINLMEREVSRIGEYLNGDQVTVTSQMIS